LIRQDISTVSKTEQYDGIQNDNNVLYKREINRNVTAK